MKKRFGFALGALLFGAIGAVAANVGPMMIQQYGADIDNPALFWTNIGGGAAGKLSIGSGLSNQAGALTAAVQSVFGRTGAVALQPSDITGALGYTPLAPTGSGAGLTGLSWGQLGGVITGPIALNGGTTQDTSGGTASDQTANPYLGGLVWFHNLITGDFSRSTDTYPGGEVGYGCVATTSTYPECFYASMTNTAPTGAGAPALFNAFQGVNGAGPTHAIITGATTAPGATSGETSAGYFGITSLCDPTKGCDAHGPEIAAEFDSTFPANEGMQFRNNNQNSSTVPAFLDGILFNLDGGKVAAVAYIGDDNQNGTHTRTDTTPYGVYWHLTSFTSAEYFGPGFEIGPTVAGFNSRVEVTGSATGAPIIAAVGAGATPATTASLNLSGLGGGAVSAKTPLQLPVYTVAALPTCTASLVNSFAAVSDAASPTYNGALTGGGSVHVPAFCNGSMWTAH